MVIFAPKICDNEKTKSSYSPLYIACWKGYARKKWIYNKTENWNIAPSFPGNSFGELQVIVWFKICIYIMNFDINKRLFKFIRIKKTKFDLKLCS